MGRWSGRYGIRGLVCLAAAATVVAGCAAPPKATVHAEDTLLGRRLYETEQAYIYASSERAAAEVGRNVVTAIRDYQKATGHPAVGKGLVIVTDKNDAAYADRMGVMRMIRCYQDKESFGAAATWPADLGQKLTKAEKEVGPEVLDQILLIKCSTTDMAEAVRQWNLGNRPAAGAAWVLTMPTGDLARQAIHGVMQKAMSQKDVTLAQKVLVVPLAGLIEAKAQQAAEADREVGVYLMLAWNDPALDEEAKKAVFQKYGKRKGEAVAQGMSMPGGMNKRSATSRPASEPANGEPTSSTPATRTDS